MPWSPCHTWTPDLRSLGRSPSVHSISCPAWFVPRGMMFYSSLKIDVLFFPTARISGWFRKVEIIIKKISHACESGPRVPYLSDVSMFPKGRKGWVILQVGKDQEKEPQSTQKGEDCIDRPGCETSSVKYQKCFSEKREDSPLSASHCCPQATKHRMWPGD